MTTAVALASAPAPGAVHIIDLGHTLVARERSALGRLLGKATTYRVDAGLWQVFTRSGEPVGIESSKSAAREALTVLAGRAVTR